MLTTVSIYKDIVSELPEASSEAIAILVLAQTIEEKHVIDKYSGEIFGHELALALKNVLGESIIRHGRG